MALSKGDHWESGGIHNAEGAMSVWWEAKVLQFHKTPHNEAWVSLAIGNKDHLGKGDHGQGGCSRRTLSIASGYLLAENSTRVAA